MTQAPSISLVLSWRLSLLAVILICVFSSIRGGVSEPGSDFDQDYFAATRALAGQPIYQTVVPEIYNSDGSHYNPHPPLNAIVLAPLALLSRANAFLAFGVISLTALILASIIMVSTVSDDSYCTSWLLPDYSSWRDFFMREGWLLYLCYPFSSIVFSNLSLGTMTSMITLLVVLAWWLLRRGKPISGGVMLGLAVLLKITPLIIVLCLLFLGRFRAVSSAVAVIVIGTVLTCFLFSTEQNIFYLRVVLPGLVQHFGDFYYNISLPGLFTKLFGQSLGWCRSVVEAPWLGKTLSNLSSLMLIAWSFRSIVSCRKVPPNIGLDLTFAIAIPLGFIISPITWGVYLLPLALSFAVILKLSPQLLSPQLLSPQQMWFVVFALSPIYFTDLLYLYFDPVGTDLLQRSSSWIQCLTSLPLVTLIFCWWSCCRLAVSQRDAKALL